MEGNRSGGFGVCSVLVATADALQLRWESLHQSQLRLTWIDADQQRMREVREAHDRLSGREATENPRPNMHKPRGVAVQWKRWGECLTECWRMPLAEPVSCRKAQMLFDVTDELLLAAVEVTGARNATGIGTAAVEAG